MAEKFTVIELDGSEWSGLMERGIAQVGDMIAAARTEAARLRRQADLLDAAADSEFQVRIVRGSEAMHPVRTLQAGWAKEPSDLDPEMHA